MVMASFKNESLKCNHAKLNNSDGHNKIDEWKHRFDIRNKNIYTFGTMEGQC